MRKRILCIEDDLETAELIAEEFDERGYEMALAHDGQAGFSAVLKLQPDIVLCDVSMPVMGGFEVLDRLNELAPRFASMPFIFLTALGDRDNQLKGRPDVRAAEAQLHAATAQVGVAMGTLLPRFTITGDIGSSATVMRDLFKAGTGFWGIGADATQYVMAGGTLLHRKRAADAALDQAGALYRAAVLTAFQNVADALHALGTDADALNAAGRAMNASQRSLDVVRQQLELGSVGYLALVTAEQSYQQATIALTQARANRYADTAALFQALGGSITPAATEPAAQIH